jgi:hypothetical protein
MSIILQVLDIKDSTLAAVEKHCTTFSSLLLRCSIVVGGHSGIMDWCSTKAGEDGFGRASNPDLDLPEHEKLFREHVNDLYEVWIMTKSQWPSFMSPFECAEAVEYGCRYIAIVCKKKSLKGVIQGQDTLLLLHLGSILISQFLCIFVDMHTNMISK